MTNKTTVEAVRALVQRMAGQRLPGERDLAARLNISRPQLRGILAGLRAEGLIEQRPGSGTYAVSLHAGTLRRVVLLIDERLKLGDDPFFSHLLEALQARLQEEGTRCQIDRIGDTGPWPSLEDGGLTLGLAGRAMIEGHRPNDPPIVGLLMETDVRPGHRVSLFQLEDREAGREAARCLLDGGCRDIVFVGRPDIAASHERYQGVQEAVSASGARLHLAECHLNYTCGLRLAQTMDMPLGDGPLGIIATNDWLAAGLQSGLLPRRPERDWRIVSFDGLPLTADPALGINSLAVPIDAITQDAVAELRRLQRSPASVGRIIRYPLRWSGEQDEDKV